MSSTRHLALVPRDGLFVKDARGWHTSALGRGHGLDWPFPWTIRGALRAALGRAVEAGTQELLPRARWEEATAGLQLGTTLALRRPLTGQPPAQEQAWQRIWPGPADALCIKGKDIVQPLHPRPPSIPTLGRNNDPAREALWRPVLDDQAKPEPAASWWSDEDLLAWLAGMQVRKPDPAARSLLAPARRIQAHVGIQPATATAGDGALFLHEVVETLTADGHEWAIGCELRMPDAASSLAQPITLGAGRRLASLEDIPARVFRPPGELMARIGGARGLRILLVTPARFANGWLPDGLEPHGDEYRGTLAPMGVEVILRAALVPRPVPMAGWNMAEGKPRPIARLVPAGAVYFFERADGRAFTAAEAEAMWLAAVGSRTEEGLGRVVPGLWDPQGATP